MSSLLIIGGGMAGVAAAIAGRRAGAAVTIVAAEPGASVLAAGAWDVARPAAAGVTVRSAIGALAATARHHPFGRLGAERVIEAHRSTFDALRLGDEPLYGPIEWDAPPALVATDLGNLRMTASAQRCCLRLDSLAAGARIAVIELAGYRQLDAVQVAQTLSDASAQAGLSFAFLPVAVDFLLRRSDALLAPHELARQIESPEGSARLGAALAEAHGRQPFDAALLPAVLGLADPIALSRALGARAGVPVGEMLGGPGGPQGLRLAAALERAATDVARTPARVVGIDLAARRAGAVVLQDGGRIETDAIVLATGRFLGGGLVKEGRVRETVLDLPLFLDGRALGTDDAWFGADPTALFAEDLFGRHAAMRIGVAWDDRLRPLGRDGAVVAANLHAAGDLLEGHDPTADLSGLGVALATGHWAGRWAAEALVQQVGPAVLSSQQ